MLRSITFSAAIICLVAAHSDAGVSIDFESGYLFSGYNNVRIPPEGGTVISLSKDLKTDPTSFVRAGIILSPSPRHHFAFYAAPLRLHAKGRVSRVIVFHGIEFPVSEYLRARYRFDTYRATYRYDFLRSESLELGIGVTALFRDASVSVKSDTAGAEEKNRGVVPLADFRMNLKFSRYVELLLQGDALAVRQGRVEDVLLALGYNISPAVKLQGGYRILEGGADVKSFYGFALIHYAVIGLILSF